MVRLTSWRRLGRRNAGATLPCASHKDHRQSARALRSPFLASDNLFVPPDRPVDLRPTKLGDDGGLRALAGLLLRSPTLANLHPLDLAN